MQLGTRVLAGMVLWCCAAVPAMSQSVDMVMPKSGRPVQGRITGMNRNSVTIEVNGASQNVDVEGIRLVRFANEPRDLQRARENVVNDQRYNAAYDLLIAAKREATTGYVSNDIDFYLAFCLAKMALSGESGSVAPAANAMAQIVNSDWFGESYHYDEGIQVFGDLAMAMNYYPQAEEQFAKLATSSSALVQAQALLSIGRAQLAQDKVDEALASFSKLEKANDNSKEFAELKLLAKVGRSETLAASGKGAEGVQLVNQIIKTESDEEQGRLFGRLYNALGRCHEASNEDKQALMAYLHVDLLYYQDRESHAEALYHLTQLWGKLGESERATATRAKLKNNFPSSAWTAKLDEKS